MLVLVDAHRGEPKIEKIEEKRKSEEEEEEKEQKDHHSYSSGEYMSFFCFRSRDEE